MTLVIAIGSRSYLRSWKVNEVRKSPSIAEKPLRGGSTATARNLEMILGALRNYIDVNEAAAAAASAFLATTHAIRRVKD